MLIILPAHLRVSGITTWAMRAVRGLRERSVPAGLLVHTFDREPVPDFLAPYVVAQIEDAPPVDKLKGDLSSLVPAYLSAIKSMYEQTGEPVVVSPNLHGDCYGAIATIARDYPELVRVVSWIHSDNEYDIAVTKRYEPMIHGIVSVSSELSEIVHRVIPERTDDVFHIPYSVDVSPELHCRESLNERPLRIVYTGRLDEHQKRVSSLPRIAHLLREAGLDFEFRIVGDGPMMSELVKATEEMDEVTLVGSVSPHEVREYLQWGDAWVLPSRYEGQSVAMLEALSEGCVPIVTKVRSGSQDAVIPGLTGVCVESNWNTPIDVVAQRISAELLSFRSNHSDAMAINGHLLALRNHSIPVHIEKLQGLDAHVKSMPDRPWPQDVRPSYSGQGAALDGSTPSDALHRMQQLLASLKGKRVLIYCSGQHTNDVSAAIESAPVDIVGIIDDDPSKVGTGLIGYPIYTSKMIPELGATEVVISSWIYEDTIWTRRTEIEELGVQLHRLYPIEDAKNR